MVNQPVPPLTTKGSSHQSIDCSCCLPPYMSHHVAPSGAGPHQLSLINFINTSNIFFFLQLLYFVKPWFCILNSLNSVSNSQCPDPCLFFACLAHSIYMILAWFDVIALPFLCPFISPLKHICTWIQTPQPLPHNIHHRKEEAEVICYKFGKRGHIMTRCQKKVWCNFCKSNT